MYNRKVYISFSYSISLWGYNQMEEYLTESEFLDEKLRIARRMKHIETSDLAATVVALRRILEENVHTTSQLRMFAKKATILLGFEVGK